jgi:WD40 repeat protein
VTLEATLPAPEALADGARRFFLAGVVSHYSNDQSWDREELAGDLQRMVELFTADLGYEYVREMGLNPTWLDIREALRDFCTSASRQPDDYVAVYLAGHGEILPVGDTGYEHVLLPSDALPGDLRRRAVKSADLAEWILAETPVRRLLLIVDACFSGLGGLDFARNALARIGTPDRLSRRSGSGVVVVTATQPAQQAIAGAFTAAFVRAVRNQATAGHAPGALSIDAVMNVLKADPELPASQQAQWSLLAGSDAIPDFLPNPRRDAALVDLDLAEQDRRWQIRRAYQDQRAEEMRGQFVPRIAGFTGRHRALVDLTRWLDTQADSKPVVVTGDPGSGKTAILGILAALADPRRRPTIPRDGLPENGIPREDAIGVAIYAGNLTTGQILAGLAAAVGIDDIDTEPAKLSMGLSRLLYGLRQSGRPLTAMVDALDEADDPPHLAEQLLRPLIERGRGLIRLLLGTRRHVCDHLGRDWRDRYEIIDLDDDVYADPVAIATVIRRILTVGSLTPAIRAPSTLFASCPPTVLDAVTAAIAEAAGRSFLVARILATTQAPQSVMPDPTDKAWRASLPKTAGPAMRRDLEIRLRGQAAKAVDLLRPLAYARGRGLPWEDMWTLLANALAPGRGYTNEDLLWLAGQAGSFIVEGGTIGGTISGRSVYRLYHRSLAEDLIDGRDQEADERAITAALVAHVPSGLTGQPDWSASHPYTRAHLATHAAVAGELPRLIVDPGYLACAAPPGLLAAFSATRDPDSVLVAATYERAMHRLRFADLADRLSYLELAARRAGAIVLAERIATYPMQRRWSVRWTQSPPDHPHRVLVGHRGPVREVTGITTKDRAAQAASVGDDGTVRLWDLDAAEALGVHEANAGALTAIDVVELPGPKELAVVLSAAGFLTAYELPSMACVLNIPVHSGIRGILQSPQLTRPEMRCLRLPDDRPAAVTGGPGMMTTIWDIQGGKPIVRLPAGLRPSWLEFRKLSSGVPISVSIDARTGAEQVFDLSAGRRIPNIRSIFRSIDFSYHCHFYCHEDGTPVIYVVGGSSESSNPVLFDLTGPSSGSVRMLDANHPARLYDGSHVRLLYDSSQQSWRPAASSSDDKFVPLAETMHSLSGGKPSGSDIAKHSRPSESFPFRAALEGRTITLSPVRAPANSRETIVLTGHGADVTDVDVVEVPDGPPVLVSSSLDGTLRVWDIASDGQATSSRGADAPWVAMVSTLTHQAHTIGVAIAADHDRQIAILDLGTGEPIARLDYPSGSVLAVTCGWVPGVGYAAITFHRRVAHIWQLPEGNHVAFFRTYVGAFRTEIGRLPMQAAYVPLAGRPLAVTCGHGERAIVWDLVGRRIHNVLGRHTRGARAVACGFTPNGDLAAATGGHDNRVDIWNVERGRRIGRFKLATRITYLRHPDSGYAAMINLIMTGHNRAIIMVLCADGKVRIFRKRSWRPGYQRAVLGASGVSSLAVMQLTDGRTVAVTGGHDGRVSAWDLQAVLTPGGRSKGNIPALIDIETEMRITNISVADNDTVVTSALNGLAAFRFHAESLPRALASRLALLQDMATSPVEQCGYQVKAKPSHEDICNDECPKAIVRSW